MVEWCPECNAMLPPGLEKCPTCGVELRKRDGDRIQSKEIIWISAYLLGIALIPILIALGLGAICVLLLR